jgi:hypothetical protein
MKTLISAFLVLSTMTSVAYADKKPKSAVDLNVDELKVLYADKTAVWSKANKAYFAPDGNVTGVAGKTYFSGKLVFKGDNEVCMEVQGTDSVKKTSDGKTYSDCWKWAKTNDKKGKVKIWTIYTKSYDDKKLDLVNGWNTSEVKTLKAGNLVEAQYKKLKGE